jgi:hypothetical protein
MAGSSSELEWQCTAKPEEVSIKRLHVIYAMAVVSEDFTGTPAEPDFLDVQCPEGCVYKVFVAWEKAEEAAMADKPPIVEYFREGPIKKQYRGVTYGVSTALASAIRKAARRTPAHFGKVTADELEKLTCTVGLIHSAQPVANPEDLDRDMPPGILLEQFIPCHNKYHQRTVVLRVPVLRLTALFPGYNYEKLVRHMLQADFISYVNVDDPEALKAALSASKISTFCISTATVSHVHFVDLFEARNRMPRFSQEPPKTFLGEDSMYEDGSQEILDESCWM